GVSTTSGVVNSFFGYRAGEGNIGGSSNSFFGERSGLNSQGINNSFFGAVAGQSNVAGGNNTILGTLADVGSPNLNFATALGAGAVVSSSNTVTLGRTIDTVKIPGNLNITGGLTFGGTLGANIVNATTQFNLGGSRILSNTGFGNLFAGVAAGSANTSGFDNSFFGNDAGLNNTSGSSNSFFGYFAGYTNTSGSSNSFFGYGAGQSDKTGIRNTIIGSFADVGANDLTNATAIGAYAIVSQSNSLVLGNNVNVGIGTNTPAAKLDVNGIIRVVSLGSAGATSLCRNASNEISTCSSSIRYKQNINPFTPGLSLIKQLRPVSFNWRADNQADFGLVAEEVNKVEPLLTTTNDKGEVEGVKYDRVGVVLVNAVQEQQTQIEAQQKQIDEQKELLKKQEAEIEALKILVCSQNPTAELCKPKK
ncbi:MAG: tail fiber domain-containing protein, partial [Actinomycetota bacterium]